MISGYTAGRSSDDASNDTVCCEIYNMTTGRTRYEKVTDSDACIAKGGTVVGMSKCEEENGNGDDTNGNGDENGGNGGNGVEKVCCLNTKTGDKAWRRRDICESTLGRRIVSDSKCEGENGGKKGLLEKIMDYIKHHKLLIGGGIGGLLILIILLVIVT